MARRTPRINPWKLFHGAFVPNWLLRRSECTQGGKLMYARLSQYAGEDGFCYPSQHQLSQELGVSDRQVRTYISELIRLKLIEKERSGLRKSDRYYFRMHPWIKAEITPPARADEIPQIPDRKHTSTLDRKHTSTLDRKHTSKKLAAAPSATKPSGRLRDSVVRESVKENQTTTTPTPPQETSVIMAPTSEEVEEVAQTIAVAQGEEATDGGIASTGVTPCDAFYEAYPRHQGRRKAKAEWDRQQLDAMLPTILSALALTDTAALPKWPHVYLENKGWLDAKPASPSARESREGDHPAGRTVADATPRTCRYDEGPLARQKCHDPVGDLSPKYCDTHFDVLNRAALTNILGKLKAAHTSDALADEMERAIWDEVNTSYDVCRSDVRMLIGAGYHAYGEQLTVDILAGTIAQKMKEYRAKDKSRFVE